MNLFYFGNVPCYVLHSDGVFDGESVTLTLDASAGSNNTSVGCQT